MCQVSSWHRFLISFLCTCRPLQRNMFGHKNKDQNVKYKLHIKIQTIAFTSSDEAFTSDNCTILTVFEVLTLKITASIYMYTQ